VRPADRNPQIRTIDLLITVSIDADLAASVVHDRHVPLEQVIHEIATGCEAAAVDAIRWRDTVTAIGSHVYIAAEKP
jgi:hypothetical protein